MLKKILKIVLAAILVFVLICAGLIIYFWEIFSPITNREVAEEMNRNFYENMFENPELAYEMTGERPRSGRDYQKFYGEGIEGFKNFTIETGIGEFETYDISGLEYYWPYNYAWIKNWSMEIHGYINGYFDEDTSEFRNYVVTGWAYRNGRWEVDYIILKRFDGGEIVQELSLGQY